MIVPDTKRLKELKAGNARLKKLLAESLQAMEVTREAHKKVLSEPDRNETLCERIIALAHRHRLNMPLVRCL